MAENDMENKRRYSREPIRVKARLLVDDQWHDCVITNSSAVGVRLYFRMSIETGKAVRIEINGFGQYDMKVVWCEDDEIGLQFEQDPAEIADLMMALTS